MIKKKEVFSMLKNKLLNSLSPKVKISNMFFISLFCIYRLKRVVMCIVK